MHFKSKPRQDPEAIQAVDDGLLALPIKALQDLCNVVNTCDSAPAVMRHIDAARRAWVGEGLLTINRNTTPEATAREELQLERIWTSDAGAYPVGGRKRKPPTPWTRCLFFEHRVFIAEGAEAMADAFDDYSVMAGLGLRAALNVPIVSVGRCVGTVNFMGAEPRWSASQVAAVQLLAMLARTEIVRDIVRADQAVAA